MKKLIVAGTAIAAAAALVLTGCGSRTDTGGGEETAGFAADAVIGVALPVDGGYTAQ